MSAPANLDTLNLPAPVGRFLGEFVEAANAALGADLVSIVLYGSAAEGRMRATSDVNLILVLKKFEASSIERLRQPLRLANAAVKLGAMFLLESEIGLAAESFAVKFADIAHRRKVIFGADPFAQIAVPRHALIIRLKQVLFNLILRLRSQYASRGLREEQLALVVADAAAPLRAAAASLLELEGKPAASPKEALERFASSTGGDWSADLARLSEAREQRVLPPGAAGPAVLRLLELARRLTEKAAALS